MALLRTVARTGWRHAGYTGRLGALLLWPLVFGFAASTESAAPMPDEYLVKAAFLYNFAKFIEWPAGAFQSPTEPISICVLGPDPFGRSLEETIAGKDVGGRRFAVRPLSDVRQAAGCHILFTGATERRSLAPVLNSPNNGMLTVGESDAFARQGGAITFKIEGGRVRFDVNVESAQKAGLRISSKLLGLARTVRN